MGGGSDTTQNTQSQSVQQFPPWINDAAQQNYAFAQNVAMQPLQQYQGQMVADVGPQMQQSWNTAATGGDAGQDQYNAAQAGYLGVLGSTNTPAAQSALANPVNAAQSALANPTSAAQISGQNLGAYMSPYTQSVINATLPIMQQNLGLQQNQQQNAASSANAFGGSRQGVQQGVTQAQGAMNMAQMAAQLNQANFAQAQQAAQYDVGQQNQVGMNNQGQANNMGQFNATQANQIAAANMAAANNMGQFNAGAQNTVGAQNQTAALNASSGLGMLGNAARTDEPGFATAQFRRADDRRPDGAAAGAKPDQCADGEVPECRQLPEPAALGSTERARDDAL